uniref:Facilitated trehalose transporter Tret1 n=1 Tax=Cacopsylla melanoneura TaxID=428564 RepID=A0A8D8SL17_9HEMI
MDDTQKSANGIVRKDLANEETTPVTTVRYGGRSACSQIMVAVAQNFLIVALGMTFGMPTVILGVLDHKVASNQTKLETPDLILNDEESSWLGSILFLFHPVGAIISGYLLEIVGRKKLMIVVCIPFYFGWILLYYATSVTMIMLGTITMSIGLGFCEAPIISYLGEVCEPRIRGALTLLTGASGNLGILVIFFINALVDWRTTTLISSVVPLLAMVMLIFLPESPIWLISKGRLAEAEQSLRWLRGWSKKDKVLIEFEQMTHLVKSKESKGSSEKSKCDKFNDELNYFKKPEVLRPFNMLMILFVITVIGALIPMRPFLVGIFQTFGVPMKPEWVLVLTGVLGITGSLVSSLTVNKMGKRPMALWSTAICFVFTLMLAICAMNLHWPGWIPLTIFCVTFWVSGYGMLILPWMLMSEIFPMQIRGVACGISASFSSIVSFIFTKLYVNIDNWVGLHGTLFIYAFITGIGFLYMYYYLPETEDRTLQEILDFFIENGDARKFKRPKRNKNETMELL